MPPSSAEKRTIRCAIYTRKSSDEGLDQTFNSLDAQREACENYISSQRHEGWKRVQNRYDDGGLSGGTLERPALRCLLDDIEADKIDLIVVYKIDRLTRSLSDFAKLVDQFDAANCSFVSVTQSFNTSTSMGRLTLNVLLSFAQFEREVTAERIRDKIAASKKKGYWMGGLLPLGYDSHPDPKVRSLVINETEAQTVQAIFTLYRDEGCLRTVRQTASDRGYRSKHRVYENGKVTGSGPLRRGQIQFILRNPVYIGRIRHKTESYEGLHSPIIDRALWDEVQGMLDSKSQKRSLRTAPGKATLTGCIFDETGDRLTPTHSKKGSRRHRYYISSRLLSTGAADVAGWRLPARQLEQSVADAVLQHLSSRLPYLPKAPSPVIINQLKSALDDLTSRSALSLIEKTIVSPGTLQITLCADTLSAHVGIDRASLDGDQLKFAVPFQLKRRGVETRIIMGADKGQQDARLIRMLALAHAWLDEIRSGTLIKDIAARHCWQSVMVRQRIQLAFLSPRIVAAILDGRQPTELTLTRLLASEIPSDWDDQWAALGFDAAG